MPEPRFYSISTSQNDNAIKAKQAFYETHSKWVWGEFSRTLSTRPLFDDVVARLRLRLVLDIQERAYARY